MADASILDELTEAEAALTSLCKAIQRKVHSKEMREEYHTLLNQATNALNHIRSFAETSNFIKDFAAARR